MTLKLSKVLMFVIAIFAISCSDDEPLPTDYKDTISFIVTINMDSSSYEFNDPESGISKIYIEDFSFLTKDFSLYPKSDKDTNLLSFETKFKLFTAKVYSYIGLKFDNIISKRTKFYKITFPLYRMNNDDAKKYKDSILYEDFRTASRYSFVIVGSYYKNGHYSSYNLRFTSDSTINAIFTDDSKFVLNSLNTIALQLRAKDLFVSNGKVLEPTISNQSEIEKNIGHSFTATINKKN